MINYIAIYPLSYSYTWHYCCRQKSKANAIDTADDKVKAANDKTKEETLSAHIYDDINQAPVKHCKTKSDKSDKLKDKVIFDVTDILTQPPAYRTTTVSSCDSSNFSSTKSNDYYIEGEETGSSKEKIGQIDNSLNTWQSNQIYNKLIHCNNQ